MQGKQGTVSSFPETLDFNHGSTSTTAVGQQLCWNNMQNSAENRLTDYSVSQSDMNITYVNPIGQENRWCLGEPSSSSTQSEANQDERKTERGWSSSMNTCARTDTSLEGRQFEPTNILSLDSVSVNPIIMQSSSSNAPVQNFNLNADVSCGTDNCQPHMCESNGTKNEQIPPGTGSDRTSRPSGSGGYLVEENDGRLSPFEGRRGSCKRKSLEGNVGQSSVSGGCSYLQNEEASAWPSVPTNCTGSGCSSASTVSDQVHPRLNLGVRGVPSDSLQDAFVADSTDNSHRNFRMRINPSSPPESLHPSLFSAGNSVRIPNASSSQHLSRLLPVDNSSVLSSATRSDNASPQNQSVVIRAPTMRRNVQPFRLNGASGSRNGSSSSSVMSGNVGSSREVGSLRSVGRNMMEHPRFLPPAELRNLVQNQTSRTLAGSSIPVNVASSSRSGSNSVVPPSAPTWVSNPSPPSRYPRRLSEYVRRSLFSSMGSETGGQGSGYSPLHLGPSSQDPMLSSGVGQLDHHQSNARSALWMERQGDGVLAIPYSLRNLAVANEGRSSRLVTEIRNVLDLMRRGEGLRFEDVMILDQSMLFGVADIHDRHRDMRLDVDNMSYEELLALEERIGNVCTGLSEDTIMSRLRRGKYAATSRQEAAEPCCICQEEYNDGEDMGKLDCGHDFHTKCIKQWLMHKNLCPICKTTGLAT